MPAGTDLITWNPRVGSTGDDRYDPGADVRIDAGDSSGYSAVPTIAEVNAGSGITQIFAELNRRRPDATNYYVLGIIPSAALVYVAAQGRIKNSLQTSPTYDWSSIGGKANEVRRAEAHGFTSANFTFTITPALGAKIFRQLVLEIRKALATDHISVYIKRSDINDGPYQNGSTWPPVGNIAGRLGAFFVSDPIPSYSRGRNYFPYRLPAGLPAIGAAINSMYSLRGSSFGASLDFTARLYRSNAFIVPISSTTDWNNATIDTLEWSELQSILAPSNTVKQLYDGVVSPTPLISSATIQYIMVSADDADAIIPPAGVSYQIISQSQSGSSNYSILKLYTA